MKRLLKDKKFYLILLWLGFTSVFAAWWMKLGFGYVDQLSALVPDQRAHWEAQKRMLQWEGLAWITLLLCGGLALMYFMAREQKHFDNLKKFFASFNHDVKTSLASLRLQAESLKEDQGAASPAVLDRLISDTMRLQVQLENSLHLSAHQESRVLLEKVSINKFVQSARLKWPQIEIDLEQDAAVLADQRALTTIFNNLIQNSLVHGNSSRIHFRTKNLAGGQVEIAFQDDGQGFSGAREKLGQLFYRHTSKSGSGIGLFVCHDLLKKMNGRMLLNASAKGFSGAMVLKGADHV